jgi:phasin
MASSPKKGQRPPVRLEQPPRVSPVVEAPALIVETPALIVETPATADEVSTPAILASAGIEPVTPPLEQMMEAATEASEIQTEALETQAEVLETPAEVVETVAEVVETAPQAVETPPVEAVAPAPVATIPPVAIEAPAQVNALGDNVRKLVEKGLVESRAKFAQVQSVATEASVAVEASCEAARGGVFAFNLKAIEALKSGADANFDLFASMASAKSMSELVALQGEFARKRYEETSSQATALAELARKVADETFTPLKAHVAKTFKVAS